MRNSAHFIEMFKRAVMSLMVSFNMVRSFNKVPTEEDLFTLFKPNNDLCLKTHTNISTDNLIVIIVLYMDDTFSVLGPLYIKNLFSHVISNVYI